jgi:hypothetical protein
MKGETDLFVNSVAMEVIDCTCSTEEFECPEFDYRWSFLHWVQHWIGWVVQFRYGLDPVKRLSGILKHKNRKQKQKHRKNLRPYWGEIYVVCRKCRFGRSGEQCPCLLEKLDVLLAKQGGFRTEQGRYLKARKQVGNEYVYLWCPKENKNVTYFESLEAVWVDVLENKRGNVIEG